MLEAKKDKVKRVLSIYTELLQGKHIKTSEEAVRFGVNERSIQRDIEDIRLFLGNESHIRNERVSLVFNRTEKGYVLEKHTNNKISILELIKHGKR